MEQVKITPEMQMHRLRDLWEVTNPGKSPRTFFQDRRGRTCSSLEEELVAGLPLFDQQEQEAIMKKARAIVAPLGIDFPDTRAFEAVSKANPQLGRDITSIGLLNFQHLMQAEVYEKMAPFWYACKGHEFKSSYSKTQDSNFMGARAKILETYDYGGASSYRSLFYIMMRHLLNVHGGESPQELRGNVTSALSGKKVLELGCGPGFFIRFLKDLGAYEVVGVEENEQLREGSEKLGAEVLFGDARNLGDLLQKRKFDVVVSKDFLSYAVTKEDAGPIMQGVYDCLSPNGITIHSIDYGRMSEERYLQYARSAAAGFGGDAERVVKNFQEMSENQKEMVLRKNILNIGPGSLEKIGFHPLALFRLDCEENLSISLTRR
jgi:SAM-dependent methyltransferase